MLTTNFIITILAALYLVFIGMFLSTSNIRSLLVFKMLPVVLGFLLALQAFKVI